MRSLGFAFGMTVGLDGDRKGARAVMPEDGHESGSSRR
jgi:hypothetical protein